MADASPIGRATGFTLIEVMVALVVFALAATALIRLQGAGLHAAGQVERSLAAATLADALALDAVGDARAPTIGDTGGQAVDGGLAWQWRRHVEATADPRVLRIDVAVADARGAVAGTATRVRFDPPRPAGQGGAQGAGQPAGQGTGQPAVGGSR